MGIIARWGMHNTNASGTISSSAEFCDMNHHYYEIQGYSHIWRYGSQTLHDSRQHGQFGGYSLRSRGFYESSSSYGWMAIRMGENYTGSNKGTFSGFIAHGSTTSNQPFFALFNSTKTDNAARGWSNFDSVCPVRIEKNGNCYYKGTLQGNYPIPPIKSPSDTAWNHVCVSWDNSVGTYTCHINGEHIFTWSNLGADTSTEMLTRDFCNDSSAGYWAYYSHITIADDVRVIPPTIYKPMTLIEQQSATGGEKQGAGVDELADLLEKPFSKKTSGMDYTGVGHSLVTRCYPDPDAVGYLITMQGDDLMTKGSKIQLTEGETDLNLRDVTGADSTVKTFGEWFAFTLDRSAIVQQGDESDGNGDYHLIGYRVVANS